MAETSGYCWHCGAPLGPLDYSRENACPQCHRHTHVCRNCRFYRPGMSNDCQEPIADHVSDKTRANFCDYFSANPVAPAGASGGSADDLLAAAEALFGSTDD